MAIRWEMAVAGAIGLILVTNGVQGQGAATFPTRPLTIILPSSGPSSQDVEYRLYGQTIREQTGKQLLIDYKGGGGGSIGMAYVAKASPDGYTLCGCVSSLVTVPFINENAGFDNIRDFAHVSLLSKRFFMLLVHPSGPYNNVREYLDYARANPGKLNWSTSGIGSSTHMPGELLHSMTDTKVTFVHYKAPSQRLIDLIAGRVHATGSSPVSSIGYVKAGKLRPLGITGAQRSKLMPDIPTIAEQGVPGYEFSTWLGLSAPAKTAPQVVGAINLLFRNASKDPELIRKLDADDTLMVNSTPAEFVQFIVAEKVRWGKIIADAGIKAED